MPRAKAARAENPRLQKIVHLALDMEVPINEAIRLVLALHLMGYGMGGRVPDEDGESVATVAWAAAERLEKLQATWNRLFRAAREEKKSRRA